MNQHRAIIPQVVQQHAEDAASIHATRSALTRAPQATLDDLNRFDGRLAAHLDGLFIAGEHALQFCDAALEAPSRGALFTAAVAAIEQKQPARLDRLFALAAADPATRGGLISAFAWVERERLQGVVAQLLRSEDSLKHLVGVAACASHRVDPGLVSARWLYDSRPEIRARALRTAGEAGLKELVAECAAATGDEDAGCRFWGAWAAVLLGDRDKALDVLTTDGTTPGVHRGRAFRLGLQAISMSAAHRLLQDIASRNQQSRWLIRGTGIAGDPTYANWLIGRMKVVQTARLAGEAFSLMTGADLAALNLERTRPEDFESGPNDDPNDADVDMDGDEGLPWPDPDRVDKWWSVNAKRFQPGTRYFIGAPVTREHCIHVLKTGCQRQRILAAGHLCLLEPGTPLFNTSAPAWRQQRLLSQMSGR